jgi:DNA-binding CsgD family transcriptional regulator
MTPLILMAFHGRVLSGRPRESAQAMADSHQLRPVAALENFSSRLLTTESLRAHYAEVSGFVVVDLAFTPVYANDVAIAILTFGDAPDGTDWVTSVQKHLRRAFGTQYEPSSAVTLFLSGRRQYVCRAFPVQLRPGGALQSLVALVIERVAVWQPGLTGVRRRYNLSPREFETLQHLVGGLTTKEIAERMSISVNTVKQFVRLIMSKMGVTTRSGIVGKILVDTAPSAHRPFTV